jgi:hypothetical protein
MTQFVASALVVVAAAAGGHEAQVSRGAPEAAVARPDQRPALPLQGFVEVWLRDGRHVSGTVVVTRPDELVIRRSEGEDVVVHPSAVVRIRRLGARRAADASPSGSRSRPRLGSLLGPTPGGPRRGQTRFGLAPLVQTGVTDHVSVGVMPLLLPTSDGISMALFATVQAHWHTGGGREFAGGVMHSEWFERGRLGLAYGSFAARSESRRLTATVLVPYAETDHLRGRHWIARAATEQRLSDSATLFVDGSVTRSGAVLMTTIGVTTAGRSVVRAGLAMHVREGQVERVLPILLFSMGR